MAQVRREVGVSRSTLVKPDSTGKTEGHVEESKHVSTQMDAFVCARWVRCGGVSYIVGVSMLPVRVSLGVGVCVRVVVVLVITARCCSSLRYGSVSYLHEFPPR